MQTRPERLQGGGETPFLEASTIAMEIFIVLLPVVIMNLIVLHVSVLEIARSTCFNLHIVKTLVETNTRPEYMMYVLYILVKSWNLHQ